MQLKLREFRPRIGPREYRVVQPWHPLRHTALADPTGYGWLVGDHDGLSRLAALFSFVAYSRQTIVHIPLRDGVPMDGWYEQYLEICGGRVDLVLVHHSLGLRPANWPDLRRRPVQGTPLTVRTDEHRTARDAAAWNRRCGHARTREWLRPVTHARTLFLTGSRGPFTAACTEFEYAAGWGPRQADAAHGDQVLASSITSQLLPDPDLRRPEVDISFKAHPPCANFRRAHGCPRSGRG
ncbi:hypothetical protein OOK13_30170 [Streptomyces sp. NBC_00378]|uniref:hypothetical protein n=1 Tax=unclassified Streptomyces TaxID=2593676 RepID=UPI00224F8E0D|nr:MULTISPECIES: hypothetical protein [unclassified Streptomyces]MCX5112654.1 hypothetical protein [Streptomyces sp. NBC_00378]